ncbi:MAG: hypothetical protein OXC14_14125 [Rhodospirillaceae bacterium]|nr:hypothetical protein [Rhodospirillaceae bacterium]
MEVYRGEAVELRGGDTVRFTRNDSGSGLTNGDAATVESIDRDGVWFRLENGSVTKLGQRDSQLRHIDRARGHRAFHSRSVDRILAAMPTGNRWNRQHRKYRIFLNFSDLALGVYADSGNDVMLYIVDVDPIDEECSRNDCRRGGALGNRATDSQLTFWVDYLVGAGRHEQPAKGR